LNLGINRKETKRFPQITQIITNKNIIRVGSQRRRTQTEIFDCGLLSLMKKFSGKEHRAGI